jgi:hypothetical protein
MMIDTIDDLVRDVTEKVAERDGPAVAVRAGAKLRSMLVMRQPRTQAEAQALADVCLRDGDR